MRLRHWLHSVLLMSCLSPLTAQEAARPDPRALMLEVERNQQAAEAAQRDYTYKVKLVNEELSKSGSVKKTTVTEADSFTIDGVRVDKLYARNGKPLSDAEKSKEDAEIDKQIAKAKERRSKRQAKGQATDARGDDVVTVSRILELGSFSNLREGSFAGRPAWIVDYAGNPNADTRSEFEKVMRDLIGTVWIDQADRTLVAAHGEFRKDFKVGGGLLANIHQGTHFDYRAVKIDGQVWLPGTIDAAGSMRYLLFAGFNGRIHMEASDFRKFRASARIVSTGETPAETPSPESSPKP